MEKAQNMSKINYMASEYQGDAMQYRSQPGKITVTDGTSDNLYLDEMCVPNQFEPYPTSLNNAYTYDFDGDITITPDKRVVRKSCGGAVSRTVSFKDVVDVHSPNHESIPRSSRFEESKTTYNGTKPKTVMSKSSKALKTSKKSKHAKPVRKSSLESIESTELTQSSEDSLETVDASAEEYGPTRYLARVLPEHPLARPEFSSILQLKQRQHVMQKSEIDVISAVTEKLSIDKNRTKFEETALKKLNRDGTQFQQLQSTEVSKEKIRKSKPTRTPSFVPKAERVKNTPEPDIMEFFKHEFQKETASFTVETSGKSMQPCLQTADPSHVFDVYRHIRSWEGW